jgi:hypothetical protein
LQAPLSNLATPRLVLRQWRETDLGPLAALNADPVTMEAHFTPCVDIAWRLSHACWGRGYVPQRPVSPAARGLAGGAAALSRAVRIRLLHRSARCSNMRAAAFPRRRARCWHRNEAAQSVD